MVTAGAAQALAKGQRTAIGRRVVLSGTGPFLLPVASSLLAAGARVLAVYEAGSPAAWLRSPLAALRDGRGKLPELAGYAAELARHRVPYRPRHAVVAAHGGERVESVSVARLTPNWRIRPGSERRVTGVDAVCVGYGFTPQLELALAAGCALRANAWVAVDAWQATSVPGVYAAGEPTGIGGAELAAAEGEVAGIAAAAHLGARPDLPRADAARRRVLAGRRFARLLAAAHPVRPGWRSWLRPDTLICRCEEVTYGELRAGAREHGADGMRALKLTTRVGLGPCQGRICARNAAELLTGLPAGPATGLPAGLATGLPGLPAGLPDPHTADRRPLAQPVRLADLAAVPAEPLPDHSEPQSDRITQEPDHPASERTPYDE
ncbi:(2Fe-2S)-binding protein [Streptomyces sp. MST-110588]|nr:(2Fe-2S)-binding protein [Streptomyces sp. MST-110588]